ncbi:flippase-like domain-containing protein [candidate division WOR-3 bacterium]|nr:flippase-like domain-containing protein [candidate division WOR-3 bacterium]
MSGAKRAGGGLKGLVSTVGRVLLSAVLLGLLLWMFRAQLPDALARIRAARASYLALALGWYLVFVLISSWRWKILLAARGLHFSTWYLGRVFVLSLFFCKLLPTSIGGDVFRISYTARPGKAAEAFSATLLDRLIGFVSLLLLAVLVSLGLFAFSPSARALELPILGVRFQGFGIAGLLAAGLLLLVLVLLVFFNDRAHRLAVRLFGRVRFLRLGERLDRVYDAVKQYRHHRGALALSIATGIGVQAALALSWHAVARAIGGTVPLVYYLVFIPLLNIVVNIPTIGGLGVREWAYVLFFTPEWVPGHLARETALAAALLFLALDLVFALAGGLLFAVMRRRAGEND